MQSWNWEDLHSLYEGAETPTEYWTRTLLIVQTFYQVLGLGALPDSNSNRVWCALTGQFQFLPQTPTLPSPTHL